MNKTLRLLCVLLLFNCGCTGQIAFKKLLRYNLPPFGVTFHPKIINQTASDYTFVEYFVNHSFFFKLDSTGNFLYFKLPEFGFYYYDLISARCFNDKIYFVSRYNFVVTDTACNVLTKKIIYNDSIFGIPNVAITRSITTDDKITYSAGGIGSTTGQGYSSIVIKFDSIGNILWSRYINGVPYITVISKPILNYDGSLYVLLRLDSSGQYKSTEIAKLDTSIGKLIWSKKYFESPYVIKDIMPYDSISVLLYGMNDEHPNGIHPYWDDSLIVMRIDTGGNVMWCRKYREGTTGLLFVQKIINTTDSGFLLTGSYAEDSNATGKTLIIKFDSQFNIQWARKHQASLGSSYGKSVIQTNDGGYLVSGGATLGPGPNDVYAYIIKTDSLGSAGCFEDTLAGIVYTTMTVTPVDLNYTTDTISIYTAPVAIGDTMMGSFTEYDACVFLGVEEVSLQNNNELIVYPNPASDVVRILLPQNQTAKQIEVYDIQGREVMQSDKVNSYPLQLDVSALMRGIYVVRVVCKENTFTARLVVE